MTSGQPLDEKKTYTLASNTYLNGKIFMIDGIVPSVEVKRADLAEVAGEDGDQPRPD